MCRCRVQSAKSVDICIHWSRLVFLFATEVFVYAFVFIFFVTSTAISSQAFYGDLCAKHLNICSSVVAIHLMLLPSLRRLRAAL
jgi:hypothetical protein